MAVATELGDASPPVRNRRSTRNAGGPPDRWANRDALPAFGFLSPNLLLFTVFIVIPVLLAVALSFTSWSLVGFPKFVGLANFREMLHDPMVGQSIETTFIFLGMGVVPTVVLGLLLAMLVNIKVRFIAVLRTLYFVPAVVSFAASAVLWEWIYRPGSGILDYGLHAIGFKGPAWLANTTTALPALDIIGIWLSLPVAILLYLAALQRIPQELIEAATLDGAGAFRRVRYIVVPGVRNMTVLVSVVAILAFTNGSFDLVNIMTQGGPINATTTLIYYIFFIGFSNIQLGYAAALSLLQLVLFVFLLAALALVGRLARR